jgi:hypothetical protein
MVKGEAMIDRPPEYGMTCHCGMRITGTNEKGVVSLFKKHYESGDYHVSYERLTNSSSTESQQEFVINQIMLSREKKMPIPNGDITTTEILVPEPPKEDK